MTEPTEQQPSNTDDRRQRIREAVRFFYDLQKLRIQQGNRAGSATIMLEEADREFHNKRAGALNSLERAELRNVERLCKKEPIYEWLRKQRGVGPTLAGVIISEIDVHRAPTVSALWRFAGLDVRGSGWTDTLDYDAEHTPEDAEFTAADLNAMDDVRIHDEPVVFSEGDAMFYLKHETPSHRYWISDDGAKVRAQHFVSGHAPRPTKGQKLGYNAWLRTKLVGVMADCMIKSKSPWREFYDQYKHRKQHSVVQQCMACEGTTKAKKGENKGKKCKNCNGTGGPAPWGESDGHRHRAAMRYMVKMFLAQLWEEWRKLEGLEIPRRYSEAVLGRVHGDHGGINVSSVASMNPLATST